MKNVNNVYDIKNLQLSRDGRQVLTQVSLQLAEGRLTGLIGPNSAGKSSLLEAMFGFLPADSGEIHLLQKPLAHWQRTLLARTVAYLPQQHTAHWPVSVYDYVALGRIPHLRFGQAPGPQDKQRIDQAIEETGIRTLSDRAVTQLSGGELCRVAIARTLAVDARIMLVDEPIAGLDPHHQIAVMQLLQQQARNGKAVMTVMHDLGLASRFCDRLWLLDQGRIVCSGTPAEVLTPQNLRQVYRISCRELHAGGTRITIPWECSNE